MKKPRFILEELPDGEWEIGFCRPPDKEKIGHRRCKDLKTAFSELNKMMERRMIKNYD